MNDFATGAGGRLYAASIHGNFTGRGADLIIVDDPLPIAHAASLDKIHEVNRIFDEAVVSRLNNPSTGKILIIMHRLHEDDLCGHVLQTGAWSRTVLPLIAPRTRTFDLGFRNWKRQKGEVLRPDAFSRREIKRWQKTEHFQLLCQQNPVGNSFIAVKRRHFGTFKGQPELAVVLSIDTSLVAGHGASFNVVQAWCREGNNFLLIDQWRDQCGYERLRERTWAMIRKHRPAAILVERTGSGAALLDELSRRHKPIPIVPEGSKVDRFRRVCRLIYSGKVLLPEDAPWLEAFLEELTHFPSAETDDQVDAATQALAWLFDNPGLEKPPARALIARSGTPLRSDGKDVAQAPGMVARLNSNYAPNGRVAQAPGMVARFNSNYAPNGPFVQSKAWVEFGSLRADGSRSDDPMGRPVGTATKA
jgi:predicted phage terminase large subunit-like protein